MSIGNQITAQLNNIETFIDESPRYLFPIKLIGWLVLFIALMITNLLAIVYWPISLVTNRLKNSSNLDGFPVNTSSEKELEKMLANNEIVLVDFWAQWCGPCLLMNKTMDVFAQNVKDKITVVKVDVSLNAGLSKSYGVRGLPTVILFKNGREKVRKSGSLTLQQLSELTEISSEKE